MTILDRLKIYLDGDASGMDKAMSQAAAGAERLERRLASVEKVLTNYETKTRSAAFATEHFAKGMVSSDAATRTALGTLTRSGSVAVKAAQGFNTFADAATRAGKATQHFDKSTMQMDASARRTLSTLTSLDNRVVKGAQGLSAYSKATKEATSSGTRFTSGLVEAGAKILLLWAAMHRVKLLLKEVFDVAEQGARAAAAEKFFVQTGKSIEDFRAATRGLISDADLMKKANLADTMGISEESFKTLAEVAHASALKTGQSFDYMFNSIILGTARESRLLLDNLGIIVNVKEAKLEYAKSLIETHGAQEFAGMSAQQLANSLSDAGEKAAFFHAVNKSGQPILDEQARAGMLAADNFDKWSAAVDNLKTALGKLLSDAMATKLGEFAGKLTEIADALNKIRTFGGFSPKAITEGIKGAAGGFAMALGGEGGVTASPAAAIPQAVEGFILGAASVAEEQRDIAQQQLDTLIKTMNQQGEWPLEHIKEFLSHPAWVNTTDGLVKAQLKLVGELNEKLGNPLQVKIVKPGGVTDPSSNVDPDKAKKAKEKEEKKALDEEEKIRDAVQRDKDELARREEKRFRDQAAWDKFVEDQARKAREAAEKAFEAQLEYHLSVMEEARRLKESLDQNLANLIGAGTNALGNPLQATAGLAGEAIGSAMGMPLVGGAIGELIAFLLEKMEPVAEIFLKITTGVEQLIDRGFNPLMEVLAPLGDLFFANLVMVGHYIGSIFRPLTPIIDLVVRMFVAVARVGTAFALAVIPLIEIGMSLFVATIFTFVQGLFAVLDMIAFFTGGDRTQDSFHNFLTALNGFAGAMLDVGIAINNFFVTLIRGIGEWAENTFGTDFGLSGFGQELSRDDFEFREAALEATGNNTDATRDNTRAVRDLSRELRNLPQGYKINYAFYNATDPVAQAPRLTLPDGLRNPRGGNFRFRT